MNGRWTAAVLLCASSLPAVAQTPRALVCEFVDRHSASLVPSYEPGKSGDRLTFTFAAIDEERRLAQAIGNAGAVEVTALVRSNQIQFIEVTPTGNMALTSVFTGLGTREKMPAVHSRHMWMIDDALVSQFAGTCAAKD